MGNFIQDILIGCGGCIGIVLVGLALCIFAIGAVVKWVDPT